MCSKLIPNSKMNKITILARLLKHIQWSVQFFKNSSKFQQDITHNKNNSVVPVVIPASLCCLHNRHNISHEHMSILFLQQLTFFYPNIKHFPFKNNNRYLPSAEVRFQNRCRPPLRTLCWHLVSWWILCTLADGDCSTQHWSTADHRSDLGNSRTVQTG